MQPERDECPDDDEGPIMAELRAIRAQLLAEFNDDIASYTAHIIAHQEEKKKRGFRYTSPPSRRPEGCTREEAWQ
ncbi:hypothetical protein [Longimicrobium sp.]|uniref:hypothetical protein n=1 Tax=Longimicrobium sp. TaxID=2029185 RepID=UPI002E313202|nr:hypothetical protein [Longimicrobium sp.]HEX6037579.1 hypothetical protein [Longimicrobium sp.]